MRAHNNVERTHLLDELTAAADSSGELKQLFFEDRTQVEGCTGLAPYLAHQLSRPLRCSDYAGPEIEFVLSVVRLLGAMCFDMQLQTSCLDMLSVNELVANLLARGAESFNTQDNSREEVIDVSLRVLREDLMDAQAALLLALDAMQQYEDFRLYQHQQMRGLLIERTTSVMQQALHAPALTQWLPKFFKRVCVAVSRVAIAIEQEHECEDDDTVQSEVEGEDEGGETDIEEDESDFSEALDPLQMLALWRSVTVLDLFVKSDVAAGSDHIPGLLLRTRKDYIE
ncbi:unnamed protein product [Phytophthora lilii]|uniref:Unnamed protein product n=1 Tax=Phytophthora lilii TaxID=2077276 RepID=A0A9W6UC66_9STRA|nr:unnamed protein product [Phytophthora lilii]